MSSVAAMGDPPLPRVYGTEQPWSVDGDSKQPWIGGPGSITPAQPLPTQPGGLPAAKPLFPSPMDDCNMSTASPLVMATPQNKILLIYRLEGKLVGYETELPFIPAIGVKLRFGTLSSGLVVEIQDGWWSTEMLRFEALVRIAAGEVNPEAWRPLIEFDPDNGKNVQFEADDAVKALQEAKECDM